MDILIWMVPVAIAAALLYGLTKHDGDGED